MFLTTQNKLLVVVMMIATMNNKNKMLLALFVMHCNVWGSLGFVLRAPTHPASPTTQLQAAPDSHHWNGGRDRVSPDVRTSGRDRFSFPRTQGGALQHRRRPEERRYRNDDRRPMRNDEYRRPIARDERRRNDRSPIMHDHVQGGSLRTWDNGGYYDRDSDMDVTLSTEGRPLDALYEVWDGPNRTPTSIKAYSEDGALRPFHATVGNSPTMSVRNTAPMEFPLSASMVEAPPRRNRMSSRGGVLSGGVQPRRRSAFGGGETIQGGALKYYEFQDPMVESVHISLNSDGMPLSAVVELLQGPNSVRQIAEIDSEDGYNYPLECEVETPGYGSTILIKNTGPLEFPIRAMVEPRYR